MTLQPPFQSVDNIQALVRFSDQPQTAAPVLVESISAMPLEMPTSAADIPMSESTPDLLHKSDDLQTATLWRINLIFILHKVAV